MEHSEIAGMAQDQPIENAPPPAYSTSYGLVDMVGDGLNTHARVAGTLRRISSSQTSN
jgi:hypothetical protein